MDHEDMSVKMLREKKRLMEERIVHALNDFYDVTGVRVTALVVENFRHFAGDMTNMDKWYLP